jgi:cytochrome-b5 reductase
MGDSNTIAIALVAGVGVAALLAFLKLRAGTSKQTGSSSSSTGSSKPAGKPVLEPGVWQSFKLIEKESLTKDVPCPVTRFRFALPTPDSVLGLPVGQHISLRCINPATEKPHMRSYTPTTSNDDRGYFDLVVKIYPTGVLGQHLTNLPIGHTIEVQGPKGRFTYKPNEFTDLCMLAGGSGITPMYQIACEIVKNAGKDKTKAHLIFGNITQEDIILRNELDAMAAKSPEQFDVYNVLNNPPDAWTQGSGFVTNAHIEARFPAASGTKLKILLCGPPPMLAAMQKNLESLGYAPEQIFQF